MSVRTNYAVFCDEYLLAVFAAASLAEAVQIKNQLQADLNNMYGCDDVFELRKATPAEARSVMRKPAGFALMKLR